MALTHLSRPGIAAPSGVNHYTEEMMRAAVVAYLVVILTLTGCSSSPKRSPWARCRTNEEIACAEPEEPSWLDRQPPAVRYCIYTLATVGGIVLVGFLFGECAKGTLVGGL